MGKRTMALAIIQNIAISILNINRFIQQYYQRGIKRLFFVPERKLFIHYNTVK